MGQKHLGDFVGKGCWGDAGPQQEGSPGLAPGLCPRRLVEGGGEALEEGAMTPASAAGHWGQVRKSRSSHPASRGLWSLMIATASVPFSSSDSNCARDRPEP
jgi:hypothetical protein